MSHFPERNTSCLLKVNGSSCFPRAKAAFERALLGAKELTITHILGEPLLQSVTTPKSKNKAFLTR